MAEFRVTEPRSMQDQLAEAKPKPKRTSVPPRPKPPEMETKASHIYHHSDPKQVTYTARKTQGATGVGIVIGGVVVSTGLTVLNQILHGEQTIQPVIAGFIVGTFLLIIALFSVEVAAAFALLLLTSSVLINAGGILAKVAK